MYPIVFLDFLFLFFIFLKGLKMGNNNDHESIGANHIQTPEAHTPSLNI